MEELTNYNYCFPVREFCNIDNLSQRVSVFVKPVISKLVPEGVLFLTDKDYQNLCDDIHNIMRNGLIPVVTNKDMPFTANHEPLYIKRGKRYHLYEYTLKDGWGFCGRERIVWGKPNLTAYPFYHV